MRERDIQQLHKNLESASYHGSYETIKSNLNNLKLQINKNHCCSTLTNKGNLLYQSSIGLLRYNKKDFLGRYKRTIQLLVDAGANPFWQDPENPTFNTISNLIVLGNTEIMLLYLRSNVILPVKIGEKSLFEFTTSHRAEHYAKFNAFSYNNTEYGVISALLNKGMKIESFGETHVFSLIIHFPNASTKQKIHLLKEYSKNNPHYFNETSKNLNLLELSILEGDKYLVTEILKFPEVIEWLKNKENLKHIINTYSKNIKKELLLKLENIDIQSEIQDIPLLPNSKRLKI